MKPPPDPGRPGEDDLADIHGSILREREEPREGAESIPIWLVTVFMGIVFFGGFYLAWNSEGFRADAYGPERSAPASATPPGPVDPYKLGKRLYTANCLVCHQSTGLGAAGQFPPLAGSEWVLARGWNGDEHLVLVVLHGLLGPLQVKGATYNSAMPPWRRLKDEQIAAILTYIRGEWGNDAPPISPAFVAGVRARFADREKSWTQIQLKAIPREGAEPPATHP